MRVALLLMTALTVAVSAGAGAADVYRWTDIDGRVHFSDSPPNGVVTVEKLTIRSAPTDPAQLAATEAQMALRAKQSTMESDLRQNQSQRASEDAAAKEKACEAARTRYAGVVESRKFVTTDKDGKDSWMSGADADQMKADLRAKMDETCAGL